MTVFFTEYLESQNLKNQLLSCMWSLVSALVAISQCFYMFAHNLWSPLLAQVVAVWLLSTTGWLLVGFSVDHIYRGGM